MDGTLVDSETMYTQVNMDIIEKHGQDIDRQVLLDTTGVTFEEFYTILGENWNPIKGPREIEEIFKNENWMDAFDWDDLLFPFVRYCLSRLQKKGYRCLIASSSPMNVIQAMVKTTGIRPYLDAIYSGQDCENGKPDPEIYLTIMKDYQVEPEDMIIVEDSPHGIQAGKAAGCTVIARKEERLPMSQEEADYILDDFLEIYNQVISLFKERED